MPIIWQPKRLKRRTETRHSTKVLGNTQGLKPSQVKALSRLYTRRYPAEGGYTTEQARELAALSRSIGRQIGLIARQTGQGFSGYCGRYGLHLYSRASPRPNGRGQGLRGLRLLHTHLTDSLLSQEDLMDMLFLRLDDVGVLTVDQHGGPASFQLRICCPAAHSPTWCTTRRGGTG